MYPRLPNTEEYQNIVKEAPFKDLIAFVDQIEITNHSNSMEIFINSIQLRSWKVSLTNRILDLERSYTFAFHYYNQGIQDEQWYTPTETGIEYFRNVDRFEIKVMFDYFSDHFFYNYFSILDNIGHILFLVYQLEVDCPFKVPKTVSFKTIVSSLEANIPDDLIRTLSTIKDFNISLEKLVSGKIKQAPTEQVSFHIAVTKLIKKSRTAFSYLDDLRNTEKFINVSRVRHNITHNFPHNEISSGATLNKTATSKTFSLSIGNYTTSSQTTALMNDALDLLTKILSPELFKQQD